MTVEPDQTEPIQTDSVQNAEAPPSVADAPAAPLNTEQPIMVWEAKEYAEYDRNHRWYVAVGVIGAVLTLGMLVDAAFFSTGLQERFSSVLVAVVFILATYVVIKHADDPARIITYSITKLGVHVGEKFRPYNELKMFWIIYKPPVSTLYLQTVNRFHPLIKIDLGDVDPLAVKNTLKEYLPEEQKREEDFIEKFSRMIRL